MDTLVNQLARQLADAIAAAIADDARVEACREKARAAGFERIELSVYGGNARAAALYRKAGFAHEGTRVRGRKLDGEYDDVHIMGLIL